MKEFKGLVKKVGRLSKEGVEAYFQKKVTSFGNGAKIDCPKQYKKNEVIVIILKENGKRLEKKK